MKRILVPVDFSPTMGGVLDLAREMARAFAAELHLVHVRDLAGTPVFPAAPIGYPGMGVAEMSVTGGIAGMPALVADELPNDKQTNRLEALGEDLSRRGLRASVHTRDGAVVEEILKLAEEISTDLIVMGSHGHGSVYNLLVGSVTEGILKASRRAVLLVPASAATS
jgi:nucleotide-binding universal stress UspA family protein